MKIDNLQKEGFAALALAIIFCSFRPLSAGLILVAFIIGILSLVRGKMNAGIILIVGCPVAAAIMLA